MLVFSLVMIILFLLGVLSAFIWYSRIAAQKLKFADDNITYLFSMFDAYKTHIKSMYEMEEYHGEPVFKSAILHTDTILQLLDVIIENNELTEYDLYEMMQEVEALTEEQEQEGDGKSDEAEA
jgi:hypothetical protein